MQATEEQAPATWGVEKRLTPALAAHGFTAVPTTFLENYTSLEITSAEAMVIVHLLSYKWSEKHPFPRLGLLAKKMGLTETSVRTHTRKLEQKKLLRRVSRPGHSNAFDLTPLFKRLEEKLEEVQAAEPKTSSRKRTRELHHEETF
jgi:DNA-binding MarR family transcriptional regulator